MLIFSENIGSRFRYATSMVLRNYEGEIQFTVDRNVFESFSGPKIYYGIVVQREAALSVTPVEEMWNDTIKPLQVSIGNWQGYHALYFNGTVQFDIFASTFYLLSRYEEYLDIPVDKHHRFEAKYSITGSKDVLREPIVDQWRMAFEAEIKKVFPEVLFRQQIFSSELTIDVDSAFAYRHKGMYRTFGGMAKDVMRLRVGNFFRRLIVLTGISKDPYETYSYISEVAASKSSNITWFFLLSDFSKEDINVPHTNNYFRKLILRIATKDKVGIHPGYASNEESGKLSTEKKRLENITGNSITRSRQHYLRLQFPSTYQKLIEEKITDDYTMGYSDDIGFRAGTSLVFPWFDLSKNETTNLMIHPFAAMDTTLNKYLHLSPDEAIECCRELMSRIENTDGNFCLLWHNETLSERTIWKGWRHVFESVV